MRLKMGAMNHSSFIGAGIYAREQEAILLVSSETFYLLLPFNNLLTYPCCCKENKSDLTQQ